MTLRISVIVATYNWPEALAAVLRALREQDEAPLEVLIADDGSRDDTRDLVEREARRFPVPLRHIWHDDTGFRLAAIRNKAIAASQGDYVVQLDGDILVHSAFVRDHRMSARRGWWVQGSRAMIGEAQTRRCLAAERLVVGPFSAGIHNRLNGVRVPALSRFVRGASDPYVRIRGCHMAFWRDDLLRVNGYNEALEGWGREDNELAARLANAGVRRRNLKFRAVAWHLYHAERSQASVGRNQGILEQTQRDRLVRCTRGVDQYIDAAIESERRG